MTPETACEQLNRFCCSLVDGQVTLKKTHSYYYQMQGQMAIANKPWCDFCVWTPNGLAIDRIDRDTDFWQQKMFPKLQTVYNKYLLPEISDPVYPTGQMIQPLSNIDDL